MIEPSSLQRRNSQLKEIARLRAEGALTESEFEAVKSESGLVNSWEMSIPSPPGSQDRVADRIYDATARQSAKSA